MYECSVNLPIETIHVRNKDGQVIATRRYATVERIGEVIREKRLDGWQFIHTYKDPLSDMVNVLFKRKEPLACR